MDEHVRDEIKWLLGIINDRSILEESKVSVRKQLDAILRMYGVSAQVSVTWNSLSEETQKMLHQTIGHKHDVFNPNVLS